MTTAGLINEFWLTPMQPWRAAARHAAEQQALTADSLAKRRVHDVGAAARADFAWIGTRCSPTRGLFFK